MTIIRTPTRAEGGITPDEKRRMDERAQLWIKRALRTDPIEPDKIIPAIKGLYAAANLPEPRVVIVPSPLVMALSYGAAAAIWHNRKNHSATYAAVDAATFSATFVTVDAAREETYAAVDAATFSETFVATVDAARDATAATGAATLYATGAATLDATRDATFYATLDATRDATFYATGAATLDATRAATDAATSDATLDATRAATDNVASLVAAFYATRAATDAAARDATFYATRAATDAATSDATFSATFVATVDATRAATVDATRDATFYATRAVTGAGTACASIAGGLALDFARRWSSVYQGGNMWPGYDAYLTAARDILGLNLPSHDAYKFWETSAIHGGFRIMHEKFCIVSDFPEFIHTDENNLPHCESGPSHRWRDGWELFHWHGTRVPDHWITSPESVDPTEVLKSENVEERAAGIAIIGMDRFLDKLEHNIIDSDPDPERGDLIEVKLPELPRPGYYLRAYCPRNGRIMEAVNFDELDEKTVKAAQAWRLGIPTSEFTYPEKRT